MAMIRYYAPLRGMTGIETEPCDAATVSDVLAYIKATYGKSVLKAAKSALIVVNDVSIDLYQGEKTLLKSDDTVSFLPLCGGG